jgi:hypothetical protein
MYSGRCVFKNHKQLLKLFKKRGINLKDTKKDYDPDAYIARQYDNKQ